MDMVRTGLAIVMIIGAVCLVIYSTWQSIQAGTLFRSTGQRPNRSRYWRVSLSMAGAGLLFAAALGVAQLISWIAVLGVIAMTSPLGALIAWQGLRNSIWAAERLSKLMKQR